MTLPTHNICWEIICCGVAADTGGKYVCDQIPIGATSTCVKCGTCFTVKTFGTVAYQHNGSLGQPASLSNTPVFFSVVRKNPLTTSLVNKHMFRP